MVARDLKKQTFWRRIVREQSGSGLSVRAWCRKHRVKEVSFFWWRRQLVLRDRAAAAQRRQAVQEDQERRVPDAPGDRATEQGMAATAVGTPVPHGAPAVFTLEEDIEGGVSKRSGRMPRSNLHRS